MATLLDVGILAHFGSVFVVLLLFVIVYGVLEATKPFGDARKNLHAIIAISIAFLFLISRLASATVATLVPWFIIALVFLFFLMLLFRMFGVDDAQFSEVIKQGHTYPWIIIISLLVLFGTLGTVFGQTLLEAGGGGAPVSEDTSASLGGEIPPGVVTSTSTATSDFRVNFLNTIRNPKILGMIFIFLTAAFMMIFLTRPVNP